MISIAGAKPPAMQPYVVTFRTANAGLSSLSIQCSTSSVESGNEPSALESKCSMLTPLKHSDNSLLEIFEAGS
jgi:hypothetical protein